METATLLYKRLIDENNICTLATSFKDKPEVATIEFAADKSGNLFFETFVHYRKYHNLSKNPLASIVITDIPHTLQMDGSVKELKGLDAKRAIALLSKKHGVSKRYSDPEVRIFKFVPSFIRLLISHKWPPKFVILKGEKVKSKILKLKSK